MFKKIKSSPALFFTLAFLSVIIVFGVFYYCQIQMRGIKNAYWQQRSRAFFGLSAIHKSADPLISKVFSPEERKLTQPTAHPSDPMRGNAQAKVTIFEFSDFTCPYCATVQNILKKVETTYKDQVKIVWKDFPLTTAHPEALKAARAGQCARLQEDVGDQFWAYHDLLFANQTQLSYDNYLKWAKKLGLNDRVFGDCLKSNENVNEKILQNMDEGDQSGI